MKDCFMKDKYFPPEETRYRLFSVNKAFVRTICMNYTLYILYA